MSRRFWSAYEDEIMRRLYPNTKTEHLALLLDRKPGNLYNPAALLGLKKTAEWKGSEEACKLRRNPEVGAPSRFKKGHVPANKGLRRPGWAPGRMAETQFKKGQMPWTWKPVGSERLSKEGYVEVKVRERNGQFENWKGKHVLIWEKAHGKVPKGHAVAFKDGDKSHVVLENLELISRVELMRRNSVHNLPNELAAVIQLAGALKRKVRNLREKQVDGSL